jgi:hypothetical protein
VVGPFPFHIYHPFHFCSLLTVYLLLHLYQFICQSKHLLFYFNPIRLPTDIPFTSIANINTNSPTSSSNCYSSLRLICLDFRSKFSPHTISHSLNDLAYPTPSINHIFSHCPYLPPNPVRHTMSPPKKQFILNAFAMQAPGTLTSLQAGNCHAVSVHVAGGR